MPNQSGHVFVVRGSVGNLACDAWALSGSSSVGDKSDWFPEYIRKAKPAYEMPKVPDGWGDNGVRAFRLTNWPDPEAPRPWFLNVGGHFAMPLEWFAKGAEEFLTKAKADLPGTTGRHGRAKQLIALPVVGIGRGGKGKTAGDMLLALLPTLYAKAQELDLDIALVAGDQATFAAAQVARLKSADEKVWPAALTDDLRMKAKALADHASRGRLALFLGAGVSASAGLPLWGTLLEQLAETAGMVNDWKEIKNLGLSLLDQALIIKKRLQQNGQTEEKRELGEIVAERLSQYHHHSLTHALLAGLPIREAITTNYDQLFEAAWTEHEEASHSEGKPSVLPYDLGKDDLDRWLLKLHGCVSHPTDIVLTRDDYLQYAEQRGALAGVVQTLLITRKLLIVGFSLDDPNFYQIVDAVRRVVARVGSHGRQFGTALMTEKKRPVAEMWATELDWVSTGESSQYTADAGRLQEIFLDYLASQVRSPSRLLHLMNRRFEGVLTNEELNLAEALKALGKKIPKANRGAAWDQVVHWLHNLGYDSAASLPDDR